MLSLHYNLLDKPGSAVFGKLKSLRKEGVLAGGTALLLQIGHRLSFDFDIFLPREIKRSDLLKLRRVLKIKEVRLNTSEQLNVISQEDVLVTLVHYPYKQLFDRVPSISLPLFSVKDIALDKAFTIGRRATWRDYVDLFFLLRENYLNIFEVVKLAEKKFDLEFNPRLFLGQLIYFKDFETTKISFTKENYSPETIKNYLREQVRKYKKKIFS